MIAQHPTRLLCTPCPDEYCKTDQSLWTVSSGCAFNRTGILCGACRTGFSAAVGTSECVANSECNPANRGLWLGVALVLYICWVLYLRCHNHTDSIRSCFFRSAVYFFQVCPLVLTRIPGHHNPVFAVIDPFLGLFDFRYKPTTYGSGSGAVCLEKSMSTLQTNLLLLYSPVVMLALLVSLHCALSLNSKRISQQGNRSGFREEEEREQKAARTAPKQGRGWESEPVLQRHLPDRNIFATVSHTTHSIEIDEVDERSADSANSETDSTHGTYTQRLAASEQLGVALGLYLMTTYSTYTKALLSLVYCVRVAG